MKTIVVIVGPTAVGKSSLALELAPLIDGEIVTADSMQVYKGMDIGTAKPTLEERKKVTHYLLDVVEPDEHFHAACYQQKADQVIEMLIEKGKIPLVVGGTGLYIRALLGGLFTEPGRSSFKTSSERRESFQSLPEDPWEKLWRLDPDAVQRIHPKDRIRAQRALEVFLNTGRSITGFHKEHGFRVPRYNALIIGLTMERKMLYQRIEQRVDRMKEQGLLEETRRLLRQGYSGDLTSMKGLGYRHMVACLAGTINLDGAICLLKKDTMRYAKRQYTWFRNQENPLWYEAPYRVATILERIKEFLNENERVRLRS